jgi:flavorubredoxin
MSRVEKLTDTVLVLSDIVPIDGRVSWLTPGAKGFEPYNEYLVLGEERALLFETGVAVHGPSLVPTLKEVLGSRQLAVYPSRIELDSIGNLGRILEEIPNTIVACGNPIEPTRLTHFRDWTTPKAPFFRFTVGSTLAEIGFPQISVVDPVIRTLGTTWLWNQDEKILFTADSFCNDMMAKEDQSVIRKSGDALIAPEGLRASILQKFDWLALASNVKLLPAWDSLFARIDPAVLAPVHGRVQFGAKLVAEVLADYRKALFFPDSRASEGSALAQGVSG